MSQRDGECSSQEKDEGEDHPGSQPAKSDPVMKWPDVRHKREGNHGGDLKRSEAPRVVK